MGALPVSRKQHQHETSASLHFNQASDGQRTALRGNCLIGPPSRMAWFSPLLRSIAIACVLRSKGLLWPFGVRSQRVFAPIHP
ncbi:hypothetical protein CBM2608_U60014 [Cupriavidus taiwanensis]|nr:hypothetical protein CBM2608_U60014 [Cupriavidus taiwanensis]